MSAQVQDLLKTINGNFEIDGSSGVRARREWTNICYIHFLQGQKRDCSEKADAIQDPGVESQ